MHSFHLQSNLKPQGDQPQAIELLKNGVLDGKKHQTMLGVTGAGKTFVMSNIIAETKRPALIISHNKTLAAQLYQEFKDAFPKNAVNYFVSYYDYYQPEAYIPHSDTYIEKDAKINEFIDRMRHASTQDALTRRDFIIVASVSCIYGVGNPEEYGKMALELSEGQKIKRGDLLVRLSELQYERNDYESKPGTYSVKGEAVKIVSPDGEKITNLELLGDKIELITEIQGQLLNAKRCTLNTVRVFPAKHFVTEDAKLKIAVQNIKKELAERLKVLKKQGKILEAERLKQKTNFDLEMLETTGYVNGVENYSRHLSFRKEGEAPYTLFDYLPDDTLVFVDESHMTIPQIRGMYNGDRARKTTLVEYGFRLPSALDNRPLKFQEFENRANQVIFVSATPGPYELAKSKNNIAEQLIRPTGLLDPLIDVRPAKNQVRDLIKEIKKSVKNKERVLVTALTKRSSEYIAEHLKDNDIRAEYLHSEIKALERPETLKKLREGGFDVLVGVNLLREGLDLPEVALVAILDADKEGFLRNDTTLIQTVGRAARHINGRAILYADSITGSMRRAIDETNRRRDVQEKYNKKHKISPYQITKEIRPTFLHEIKKAKKDDIKKLALKFKTREDFARELERMMLESADNLDFERAAELRDIIKNM